MTKGPLEYEIFTELAQFLGHSLWIGFLSALIYFLYIKSSARFTPAERVILGLTLMIAVPVFAVAFAVFGPLFPFCRNISFVVPYYLVQYLGAIWLIGISIYGFRIFRGIVQMNRTRTGCENIPSRSRDMINQIRRKLNTPQSLPIRTGLGTKGPMLCGLIKPAIIVPEGILRDSDQTCLESIIAHETAHFLRKDLWINLGQSILDGIYFFHPAMRWLSQQIRMEREKACDDFAIEALNGNRLGYASALLETESSITCGMLYAAFGSESTSDRAARIAFGETSVKQPLTGLLAVLSILIVILISSTAVAIVKVGPFAQEIHDTGGHVIQIEVDPPRGGTLKPATLENPIEWHDKVIGGRSVPMLKSIPLIERDGIVYDLSKPEPRLFPVFPNSWLLENNLNYLDGILPRTDPDGDLFTVFEEYSEGTDPKDSASHPDRSLLLKFVKRHSKLCRIKYAARTDQKTVQLTRMLTAEYPKQISYFIKAGETSPDGRIQLQEIEGDTVLLFDVATKQTKEVTKQGNADFLTWFAEMSVRGGDNFYVKEGAGFYIPGYSDTKRTLLKVSEGRCIVKGDDNSPPLTIVR